MENSTFVAFVLPSSPHQAENPHKSVDFFISEEKETCFEFLRNKKRKWRSQRIFYLQFRIMLAATKLTPSSPQKLL